MITTEEKLWAIKNEFIENLTEAFYNFVYEHIRDEGSSESYHYISQLDGEIYTLRIFIKKYFPEVNIWDIYLEGKKKAIVEAHPYDINHLEEHLEKGFHFFRQ